MLPRRSWLLVALSLLGSCRATPSACGDINTERCLWEQGVREPIRPEKKGPGQEDVANDLNASVSEDSKLDETLTEMVDLMRTGLEWSLVNARARALCIGDVEPTPAPAPSEGGNTEAWHCDTTLHIDTQSLTLEASAGVLSLSAPLDEAPSASLFELVRARFEPWCASDFEELEGTNHLVFYRCALPEGPYLVVARFPRDLDGGQWQISIAVLDAG